MVSKERNILGQTGTERPVVPGQTGTGHPFFLGQIFFCPVVPLSCLGLILFSSKTLEEGAL